MPRHGAPTGAGGLREPLTPGPGRRNSLTDSVSDLRDSVSELSESLSEFVDTALHIEDQLVEEEPPPPGALTVETRIRRRCPTREGAMVWAAIGLLTAVSVYFTMTGELGRLLKAVQDAGLAGAILLTGSTVGASKAFSIGVGVFSYPFAPSDWCQAVGQ